MKVEKEKHRSQDRKFKSRYDFVPEKIVPKGKSETIQDDSITIQTLLERYTLGMPLQTGTGVYLDDDDEDGIDLEEFNRMDITDRHEIAQETGHRGREARETIEKARKAKKDEPPKQAKNGDS